MPMPELELFVGSTPVRTSTASVVNMPTFTTILTPSTTLITFMTGLAPFS